MTAIRRATLGGILALALFPLGSPRALSDDVIKATGKGEASPLYLPSKSTPLVAIRFVFRAGSQDDPRGKEGLAALTAAMIAEGGTTDLTYDQILKKFYPIAGPSPRPASRRR